ncbi:MAG TPA: hypothetical protein VG826_15055 [Pirellulales bacterium]|nr:hypothetical protein [Pirellulales bacterium]
MTNSIELSEDAFDALFPLKTNHLNPAARWSHGDAGGCLFETYGEEMAFVREQNPRTVWTFVDADDGGQCVISGFHLVNRIGYLISTTAAPEGVEIHVRIPHRPRAERLALFSKAIACYPDFDPATNLVDLLADAMHWSAAAGVNFDEAQATAADHFTHETTD